MDAAGPRTVELVPVGVAPGRAHLHHEGVVGRLVVFLVLLLLLVRKGGVAWIRVVHRLVSLHWRSQGCLSGLECREARVRVQLSPGGAGELELVLHRERLLVCILVVLHRLLLRVYAGTPQDTQDDGRVLPLQQLLEVRAQAGHLPGSGVESLQRGCVAGGEALGLRARRLGSTLLGGQLLPVGGSLPRLQHHLVLRRLQLALGLGQRLTHPSLEPRHLRLQR
mmetsp:Transcript_4550/g.8535  ORF Transcript_4550/g.8535 Transcript_4550/m.8535 type:complete len:223 (-) Transcript_4550:644-1312(-)